MSDSIDSTDSVGSTPSSRAYQELLTNFQKNEKGLFEAHTKEFFELNPDIQAVAFEGFTPYFNDGDPCYFSIGEVVETTNVPSEEFISEFGNEWVGDIQDENESWRCSGFIDVFKSEVIEKIFGDPCRVLLLRDGRKFVSEFDHD